MAELVVLESSYQVLDPGQQVQINAEGKQITVTISAWFGSGSFEITFDNFSKQINVLSNQSVSISITDLFTPVNIKNTGQTRLYITWTTQ